MSSETTTGGTNVLTERLESAEGLYSLALLSGEVNPEPLSEYGTRVALTTARMWVEREYVRELLVGGDIEGFIQGITAMGERGFLALVALLGGEESTSCGGFGIRPRVGLYEEEFTPSPGSPESFTSIQTYAAEIRVENGHEKRTITLGLPVEDTVYMDQWVRAMMIVRNPDYAPLTDAILQYRHAYDLYRQLKAHEAGKDNPDS